MLNLLVLVLGLSGLVFVLIDLIRYDIEEMWWPVNWVVLFSILPFVVVTNTALFVWYLVVERDWRWAYDQTFNGMLLDIKDALSAGW